MRFSCIAAIGLNGQIGANNKLAWAPNLIKGDMTFFKLMTSYNSNFSCDGSSFTIEPATRMVNAVIMGRKTWDSIPKAYKPLDNRFNIIVTSSPEVSNLAENTAKVSNFEEALSEANKFVSQTGGQVFVIGGSTLYEAALNHSDCGSVFLTEIDGPMEDGDVFFPVSVLKSSFSCTNIDGVAYDLIKNECPTVRFEDEFVREKQYKYHFNFYYRN